MFAQIENDGSVFGTGRTERKLHNPNIRLKMIILFCFRSIGVNIYGRLAGVGVEKLTLPDNMAERGG